MKIEKKVEKEFTILSLALEGREEGFKIALYAHSVKDLHRRLTDILYWIAEVECEQQPLPASPPRLSNPDFVRRERKQMIELNEEKAAGTDNAA